MKVWGVLVLLAVAVTAVFAVTEVTFPEIAREVTERVSTRIVSGWEAEDGQFPFQLSLRMVSSIGGVSSCGGTILNALWGLTAAHCTAGRVTMVLRAGVVNMTRPQVIFETTEYYNHPDYDESRPSVVQPHDIGLLKFGRSLEFNEYVHPIRIQRSASKNLNYQDFQLTASGWGRTWTDAPSPENLNWVYLRGVTNAACFVQFGTIIVDSTICASHWNVTSQSTCSGDSGGPLTAIDDDGAITQVGVTSFVSGTGCHTDFPAGFIRPGHYHDWFTEVTGYDFDWTLDTDTTTTAEDSTVTEGTTAEDSTVTEGTTYEDSTATEATTTTVASEEDEDSESSDENGESSSSSSSSEEDEEEEDEDEEEEEEEDEEEDEEEEEEEEEAETGRVNFVNY